MYSIRTSKTQSGAYYSSMKICDEYGMGQRIDWAKQSSITTGDSQGFEDGNGPENLIDVVQHHLLEQLIQIKVLL